MMTKQTPFVQKPMMGKLRNWMEWHTDDPIGKSLWQIWFPGQGENKGLIDGSELQEVDNYGPGYWADQGFDWKTNILVPQASPNGLSDFNSIITEYLIKTYGATNCFMWGWSNGGLEASKYFTGFEGRKTSGIVSGFGLVAGATVAGTYTYCGCLDKPIFWVHSKYDKALPNYSAAINFINGLKGCLTRTASAELLLLTDPLSTNPLLKASGHGETMKVYTDPRNGNQMVKFMYDCLLPKVVEPPVILPNEEIFSISRNLNTGLGEIKTDSGVYTFGLTKKA